MASSGLNILFDGNNMSRILGGMWLAAKISVVSSRHWFTTRCVIWHT